MLNINLKGKKLVKSGTSYIVQINKYYMRNVYLLLLFSKCLFWGQKSFAQISNGDLVFSTDSVHIVRLFFKQPHYWDTLVQRYDTEHSEYDHYGDDSAKPLLASIQIDGKKMDSIGVKLKGNLSNSITTNKKGIAFTMPF